MVKSNGSTWSSMENSRCQSVGLVLRAAAYEALPEGTILGAEEMLVPASLAAELGVATLVPSGVWASILDPSMTMKGFDQ